MVVAGTDGGATVDAFSSSPSDSSVEDSDSEDEDSDSDSSVETGEGDRSFFLMYWMKRR